MRTRQTSKVLDGLEQHLMVRLLLKATYFQHLQILNSSNGINGFSYL